MTISERRIKRKHSFTSYPPYSISVSEVIEVWHAKAYISTVFPDNDVSLEKLMNMVMELQQEVIRMKEPKGN